MTHPAHPEHSASSHHTTHSTSESQHTAHRAETGTKYRRKFHDSRPADGKLEVVVPKEAHGNQKFEKLPPPTGKPPYHLSLDDVLPEEQMDLIRKSGRIVFHVAGDTGGVKMPEPQQIVAMQMENQFRLPNPADRPAFFYHLGDVVYYYGEAKEYFPQFYDPYVHYPAPIFSIPGNHDGDRMDDSVPSLDAWMRNFCAATPETTREAGETTRDAMTQPNPYWTLETPFVNFIGMYTNSPEGGMIDNAQMQWLVSELANAPQDRALILAAHHPCYSADSHHSGSRYMLQVIDAAIKQSNRIPDLVFAGHVHNYQRFTRKYENHEIPYIVHGSGGYWHLHYMSKTPEGNEIPTPYPMPNEGVSLESYCDNRHGFMRLVVTSQALAGETFTVPRPHESWRSPAQRSDFFALDWRKHKLISVKG
jgi:hypothetical protein